MITIIASLSIISYNQGTYLASILLVDGYIYMRLFLRYGFSVSYVRTNLYITCALVFIYLLSRALNQRYREHFIVQRQQAEMITILESVLKANHDGVVITDQHERVIYQNEPLLEILNIAKGEEGDSGSLNGKIVGALKQVRDDSTGVSESKNIGTQHIEEI